MCQNGNGNGNGRLTGKQQAFVNAYCGEAKFNATKAAEMAGYQGNDHTLRSVGYENLTKPDIKEKIRRFFAASAMTAEEVTARLSEQARAEHTQYLNADGTCDLSSLIADDKAHLVRGTHWDKDGRLVVEFYNAQTALVQVGKILGIEAPQQYQVGGEIDVNIAEWKQGSTQRIADAIAKLDN